MAKNKNKKGFDDLSAHIEKVRGLATLPGRAGPVLRKVVGDDAKANARKGIDPEGTRWRKSKKGAAVLKNAASSISTSFSRGVILLTVKGRHARHHLGFIRGTGTVKERARRVIPVDEIPTTTAKAMKRATLDLFKKDMK